jgi:single-strand DNA-binding protein
MKSLNQAMIIGNLTRDPELRYTPTGTAVASFGVATNRSWVGKDGKKAEEVDFHNIVVWGKLGEICSQYLTKGSKVYLKGRMQTRKYTDKNGIDRYSFEIIADEMIMLSSKKSETEKHVMENIIEPPENTQGEEVVNPEEIPF